MKKLNFQSVDWGTDCKSAPAGNRKTLLFCLLIGMTSCISQTHERFSVNEQAEALKKYYEGVIATTGEEKAKQEKLFFEAFPASFTRFSSLYGAKDVGDSSLYMPLFLCCYSHIELFNNLQFIGKKEYYSKYINIAIGGKWDADHVGGFQSGLNQKAISDAKTFIELLKLKKEKDIRGFWHFFYDGPHPDDPQIQARYQEMYAKLEKIDSSMALLMKEEYQKLLNESYKHGN